MANQDIVAVLTAKVDGFLSSLTQASSASDKSTAQISKGFASIQKQINGVESALQALGVAFGVHEAIDFVRNIINAEEQLGNLAQKAGITAESLGGLAFGVKNAGVDLDTLGNGLAKLERSIASAGEGNEKTKEAFDVLGISVRDSAGNIKSTDQIFLEVADKFAGFYDGANKAAIAVALFGRAGADLIPALNKGSAALREQQAYFDKYSGVTADSVAQAKEFNDTLNKLSLLTSAFGKNLVSDLLPPLQSLASSLLDAKEKGDQFKSTADTIVEGLLFVEREATTVALEIYEIGRAIGTLGGVASDVFGEIETRYANLLANPKAALDTLFEPAEKLSHLDVFGSIQSGINLVLPGFSKIQQGLSDAGDDATKAADKVSKFNSTLADTYRLRGLVKGGGGLDDHGLQDVVNAAATKRDAPGLKAGNSKAAADVDNDKKALDLALKQLEEFIAAEKQQLTDRESFLQSYYQRGFLSVADYYGGVKAARDEDLTATRQAYQEEIADLEAYIAKKKAAGSDKDDGKALEAATKLVQVRAQLAKLNGDAITQGQKDQIAQDLALQKFHDTLQSLDAQVKTLRGDTAGAFAITFDVQNRDKINELTSTVNSARSSPADQAAAQAGLDNLARLRAQGIVEAQLNDVSKQRSAILGDLSNEQSRIDLAVSLGQKTELQGLADSSAANKARVALLEQTVAAYDAIAAASGNIADKVNADALHVELEKLKASTDQVADAFDKAGRDVTTNFIDKLADSTVSLHDKMKSLLDDVTSRLLKLGENAIANDLFGKDTGLLAGVGTKIGSLFPATPGTGSGATTGAVATSSAGLFGRLFGVKVPTAAAGAASGTTGAAGAAAANTSLTTLSTTATTASSSITALSPSAIDLGAAFDDLLASVDVAGSAFDDLLPSELDLGAAFDELMASVDLGGSAFDELVPSAIDLGFSLDELVVSADLASSALEDMAASSAVGGFLGSAKGNVFSGGNVIPFARGGVVNRSTIVPMALMGEAGPEAIVPLKRGADGSLGIANHGGGTGVATMGQRSGPVFNVTQNFPNTGATDRRSQAQIAAAAASGLQRAAARAT